jgi:signal transduction histidine kinase
VTTLIEQSLVLVRPLADQKELRIRVDGPARPVQLHTDSGKVRQILVNLLANAVKFSDRGDVVLAVRTEERDVGGHVSFEVSDTGTGIATEHFDRIFEPFWQVEARSSHARGGTGLGLSVARTLARLLGGDVVVTASVLGRGSTFLCSVPVRWGSEVLGPRSSKQGSE